MGLYEFFKRKVGQYEPEVFSWKTIDNYENGNIKTQLRIIDDNTTEYRNLYETGKTNLVYQFVNGVQEGEAIKFDEIGNIEVKCNFINGKQNGESIEYFENGNINRIVNFLDNKQHGKAVVYYDSITNDKIEQVAFFDKGLLNGELVKYFENNEIKSKRNFENGELEGEQIDFYEDGQIKEIGYFVNGVQHGEIKTFTKFGMIARVQKYDNGKLVHEENNIGMLQICLESGTRIIETSEKSELIDQFFSQMDFVLYLVYKYSQINSLEESKNEDSEYLKLIETISSDFKQEIQSFNQQDYQTSYPINEQLDIWKYFEVVCIRAWNHMLELEFNPNSKFEWQESNFNTYIDTYKEDIKIGGKHLLMTIEPPMICYSHIYKKLKETLNKIKILDSEYSIQKNITYKVYELLFAHTHAAVYSYSVLLLSQKGNGCPFDEIIKKLFEDYNVLETYSGNKMLQELKNEIF